MELKEYTEKELMMKLFERVNLLELDNKDLRREVRLMHNKVRFLNDLSPQKVLDVEKSEAKQ